MDTFFLIDIMKTEQFNLAIGAMLIFPILFIYTMIRYIILSIKHNDGRYIYTETFYVIPTFALFLGGFLGTTWFIITNTIMSVGLCVASYYQNIQFTKDEREGATGSTYKLKDKQKAAFLTMNDTEKETYYQMLEERKKTLGWRYKINIFAIVLISWLPPLLVRFLMHLLY